MVIDGFFFVLKEQQSSTIVQSTRKQEEEEEEAAMAADYNNYMPAQEYDGVAGRWVELELVLAAQTGGCGLGGTTGEGAPTAACACGLV